MYPKRKTAMKYMLAGLAMFWTLPALTATNEAIDGGGPVTLTDSGAVTVTSSALQLVKQVYDTSGNCLASSPADANCNSSATSITVPAGTSLKFLIFVRNGTEIAVPDVRFQDVLDVTATGFTYATGTLKYSNSQAANATIAQIYTATNGGTAQTDAVGAPDDYASYSGGTITVGAVSGQANQTLSVTADKTFAIIFNATKK